MNIKFLGAIALAASLAGCATTGGVLSSTVNPNYAYSAVQAFNVAETTADGYLKLPACVTGGPVLCRKTEGVARIVPLIRTGRTARNSVVAALHASNGGPIDVNAYNTLQAIIGTLQSVYSNLGIAAPKGN